MPIDPTNPTTVVSLTDGRFVVVGGGTGIRPDAIGDHHPDTDAVTHHWRAWRRGHLRGSLSYVLGDAKRYVTREAAEKAARTIARLHAGRAAANDAALARIEATFRGEY